MENYSAPLPTSYLTPAISSDNMFNVVPRQNSQFFPGAEPQKFVPTLPPSWNSQLNMPHTTALHTGLQVPGVDNYEPITQPMAFPTHSLCSGMSRVATSILTESPSRFTACSGIQGISLGGNSLIGSSLIDRKNLTSSCENQRLKVLLTKKFRNCDMRSTWRIILPKRQAEINLPILREKKGIQLVFRELCTDKKWTMRYKYWDNSSGRVYILYCAKEFMDQKGAKAGDTITLYDDESKNLYISFQKARMLEPVTTTKISTDNTKISTYLWDDVSTSGAREEEDEYLAILIEELKNKDQGNANCLGKL